MAKLIHRDDLPMEDAEAIITHLKEMYPGVTVQFAGDSSDPEVIKKASKARSVLAALFFSGLCMDCHRKMENWPATPYDMADDWEPPDGWQSFYGPGDEIVGWQCPACDAIEEAEQHE